MKFSETYDAFGYLASLLVLSTFSVQGTVSLRALAIATNLAFIGNAAPAQIYPVLSLSKQMRRFQQFSNFSRSQNDSLDGSLSTKWRPPLARRGHHFC